MWQFSYNIGKEFSLNITKEQNTIPSDITITPAFRGDTTNFQ